MNAGLTPLARRRSQVRRFRKFLLAALIAFGAILGALFAYSGSANPLYVIESNSMQHSADTSHLGVLDTGDIFIAQAAANPEDVVTYVEGRARAYETYGDYGDVLVFVDPELFSASPVVHRALAWTQWNGTAGGYDVPELALLPPADWTAYDANGTPTSEPYGLSRFVLRNAGWTRTENLSVDLDWIVDYRQSITPEGFLTFGDHNVYRSPIKHDPWVLPFSLVIGKARGEIPWFGLIKLTLLPGPEGCCAAWGSTDPDRGAPANSWTSLDISLALLIGLPAAWAVVDWQLDRHPAVRARWRARWRRVKARIWPWSRFRKEGQIETDEERPP